PVFKEIDIIKSINIQTYNIITLYTNSSYNISNRGTIKNTTLIETNYNISKTRIGCS
ncbi:hypothetical protein BGZ61DRAFT_373818, partial [Ilyonectria robusta]|uniref:uncharacterized protein n=1 Tax=Ilyonectria robusta TaxID=1079257 RepID=UPI001E8D38BE